MANIVARHFLSDRGYKQLESSEGAKNVVHKKKKIGELRLSISRLRNYIGRNERKIAKKQEKVDELLAVSFWKTLMSFGKIKKERQTLEDEIAAIKAQNEGYETEIYGFDYEIEVLLNQIKEYEKRLKAVGLTADDIMEEYKLILKEFEEREKQAEAAKFAEVKAEQVSQDTPKPSNKPARQTPIEKFKARQVKHEAIVTGRQNG